VRIGRREQRFEGRAFEALRRTFRRFSKRITSRNRTKEKVKSVSRQLMSRRSSPMWVGGRERMVAGEDKCWIVE
jgi:hypothetical protein